MTLARSGSRNCRQHTARRDAFAHPLLKWADEWREVAEKLEEFEEFKQQVAREDQFIKQLKNG
jgi:hypothetical protein